MSVVACLFLVACQGKDPKKEPSLKVMVSPDNPPFEYKDTGTGGKGVIGFDVDLIRLIGKEMGRRIKVVEVEFSTLIQGVQSGRADMGISAIGATEERRKNVDFSIPYYEYSFAVVSPKDVTITSYKDLANKRVGVQMGSSHEAKAQELTQELDKLKMVSLNKLPELVLELKMGRADVLMTEEVVAKNLVKANPELHYNLIHDMTGEASVIVFPKGSPFVEEVNQAIVVLRERGAIEDLKEKWFTGQEPALDFGVNWSSVLYIMGGIKVTLALTLFSLLCGFIWGGILAVFKVSDIRPLNWFAAGYTSVFRGTPLLLQLSIFYFAFPIELTWWQAGILTFSLNSGAYISEIIRGGIHAVDKGQMEAAKSLGVPYVRAMYDIILPQAIRKILPSLVNESIDLLKESALISVISGVDILRRAMIVANEKYTFFEPLIIAGALYYIMVMILATGAKLLERKLRLP